MLDESRKAVQDLLVTLPSSAEVGSAVAASATTIATDADTARAQPTIVLSHGQLFGIEALLADALDRFDSNAGCVIGYHGIGGVGKSALAERVTMEALKTSRAYDALVLSAPTQRRRSRIAAGLTFDLCIDRLAERLKTEPSFESVREELTRHSFLLFLDNIETSSQPQSELVRNICDLVAGTKACVILTSRRDYDDPRVQTKELTGLEIDACHKLIKHIGKGIPGVDLMTMDEVAEVRTATSGIPLAINLVVPQLRSNSLQEVVDRMKRVDLRSNDENATFYREILDWSWGQVTAEAQEASEPLNILRYIARQPGSASGAVDTAAILESVKDEPVSEEDRASVIRTRDLLVKFAMLEVVTPPRVRDERRFYLHSIVQQYVYALEAQVAANERR